MFKEDRDESQFNWSMLGDIEKGRPNLGPMCHVAVYRLMQYTIRDILIRDFGVEKADRIFFEAGKKAGAEFCENILTEKDIDTRIKMFREKLDKELGKTNLVKILKRILKNLSIFNR